MNILNIDYALPVHIQGLLHRLLDLPTPTPDMDPDAAQQLAMEEAILIEEIEGHEQTLVEHSVDLHGYWRNNQALLAGVDHEIARLKGVKLERTVYDTRVRRVLNLIAEVVPAHRLQIDTGGIAIKKNPHAVHINDEAAVPDEYKEVEFVIDKVPMQKAGDVAKVIRPLGIIKEEIVTLDKASIKKALKDGAVVDGAELTQGTRLEVK